ncbi:MAG: amino acid permease [Bryobacteraceae bacterium]|nr:amino acid permease [Bryobacteraceae bacterium]MDW8379887.1 amino acid permease [Bryobacterales bacterium]
MQLLRQMCHFGGMRGPATLERDLSFLDSLAIVLGIMIGAGIFALPARVAQYASRFVEVIPLWLAAGLISLLGAFIYAELGARYPKTGGEYVYLRNAFGELPAFLYGWSQLLVIRTNPGAGLALVFAEHLASLTALHEWARIAVAGVLIWFLGLANYAGLKAGKGVQLATTVTKVAGMLLLLAAGAALGLNGENLSQTREVAGSQPAANFANAMLLVLFAYLGWDRLGNVAGEMRQPLRDLPRALVLSLVLVMALYLALNVVIHSALGIDKLAKTQAPAADVAELALGPVGRLLLAIVVMTATASSINATILSSSRVYYVMAQEGLLPEVMGRIHPRYRTPHVAVVTHCFWASVLLLGYRNLEALIGSQVFSMMLWYGVMAVGYLRIRSQSDHRPEFVAPFSPAGAYLFVLCLGFLAVTVAVTKPLVAAGNILLIASGAPIYWGARAYGRRSSSA